MYVSRGHNKLFLFFFSSRIRHTISFGDWSSDVCSFRSTRTETAAEAVGVDGIRRLYAFRALGDAATDGDLFFGLGVPSSIAYDLAAATARNLIGMVLSAALAFVVAWSGANLLVLRPIGAMIATTRRLRAGDLSARTGLRYGGTEVDQLASAFDDTAAQLQAREEEATQIREELRQSNA